MWSDNSSSKTSDVKLTEHISSRDFQPRFQAAEPCLDVVNSELETFCSCVSHDLRAPLRHINSYSALLLQDFASYLPVAAQDYIERINRSSSRMGYMIDELLELSRLSRTHLVLGWVDLSEMARQVIQRLMESEKQRDVETVIASTPPVLADMGLLVRVMENLLGNAWKFTSGTPSAKIEFGMTQYQGGQVFFIKDNGAGFDMSYASKLFGTFERLHGPEFEGVGIGLAIADRIVRRHGGSIWGEGVIEEGATFYFSLPVPSDAASPTPLHSGGGR